MDSATSLYRSVMRPFRDRPDIKIPGRWYWCPEGAKALPFAHAFLSYRQDSSTTEGLEYELGEIPEWHGLNTHVANSRYTGQHWCGTEEDWQKGAIYGQAVLLDAEGVPVCCQGPPLRPGGGAIVIKTPAFSLTSAMWWLNPDTLQGLSVGDEVSKWINSDPSPNPGVGVGSPNAPKYAGQGVILEQFTNGLQNAIHRTINFVPGAGSWYLVGGGVLSAGTHQGPAITFGAVPNKYTWRMSNVSLRADVSIGHLTIPTGFDPPYGIWSFKYDGLELRAYQNGSLIGNISGPPGVLLYPLAFVITPQSGPHFLHTATLFSEYLLFFGVLSDVDDYTVLSYLSRKYGIPLGPENTYFAPGYFPPGFWRPWYYPLPSPTGTATRFFATGFFPSGFFAAGFFP